MNKIIVNANAKINLSIDVLGVRDDGYHDIEMIMQSIPLSDKITICIIPRITSAANHETSQINLTCSNIRLPTDIKNIAFRAAQLIIDSDNIRDNISIHIDKHIPVGGGLGGGSADAAGVLHAMNKLFNLGYSTDDLMQFGSKIGSDVPFLVKGGTMYATGTGTRLSSLPSLNNAWLVVTNPGFFLSTERVYKTFDTMEIEPEDHPDTPALISALERGDLHFICRNMKNVLEHPSFFLRPEIRQIKSEMLSQGALGALMSGSGSTVFGIFRTSEKAWAAMKYFRKNRLFSMVCKLQQESY